MTPEKPRPDGEWFITEFIGGGTFNIIANAPDPMKRRCLAYAIDENAAALIMSAHNAALASHARTIEALRAALVEIVDQTPSEPLPEAVSDKAIQTSWREMLALGAIARRALKEHL